MARVLYAADGFGGVTGTSIAGRTLDGAGKVPPLGVWTLAGGSPTVGDVRVDGSGNAYQAFTNEYSRYYVDGLGAAVGTDYDVEIDLVMVGLNTPGGIQPAGYTRIDVRIQPSTYANPVNSPPGHDNLGCYYTSFQTSITPLKGFFQAYGGDQIGSIASAAWLPTLNVPFTIRAEVRTGNTRVLVYWNNLFVTTITDPLFGGDVTRNFNSGPPGLMAYADPNGYDWKIAEYRIYLVGRANPIPPPPSVPIPTSEVMSPGPIYWGSADCLGPQSSEVWATHYGFSQQIPDHTWALKPGAGSAVADRYGYFLAIEPSTFTTDAYKSFFGHKFWNTELGRFVRVTRAVIHGKFLWTTVQQNHLEVFALHSQESKDRQTYDSGVQCWLGLRTDGHFEFFRGWTSGTMPLSGVVDHTATGTSLGVSPESVSADIMAITTSQARTGSGGNDFQSQFPAKLRKYVFDVVIHPLNGSLTVWKENDAGDMTLFWCLQGINTQGADAVDALFFTVGQRGSKRLGSGGANFGLIGNPFTGSFGFAFRIQEVVVAGYPLGGCDVTTLYTSGSGDFNQFAELTPPGLTGISRYKYVIDALQPLSYGFPSGTSDDASAVVQPEAETAVDQEELFTHETLPDPGKPIVGVCVMPKLATRQRVLSFTAQGRPALRLSGTTYVGVARPLFEYLAPEMAGIGPPIPPLAAARPSGVNPPFVDAWQGLSTISPRYQDWFSLIGGDPWDLTMVNAVQMGCVASVPPVHLSGVSLLVVSADPLPVVTSCCGAADTFTGGDVASITGRTPDGGGNVNLANGLYFPITPAGLHFADPDFEDFVFIGIAGGVAIQVTDADDWSIYVLDLLCCLGSDYTVGAHGSFQNLSLANPDPLGQGYAWFGVGARFRSTEESGYNLILTDNGTWWLSAPVDYDYGSDVGDGLLLAQGTVPDPLVDDETHIVQLDVRGNQVRAIIDGLTVATVTDFTYATGLPALDMRDAAFIGGSSATVSVFEVDGPGGGCGGGGGGGGNPETPGMIATMKNGAWREVPVPSETTDAVQVFANGPNHPGRGGGFMANGLWRLFGEESTPVLDPDDPDTPDTFVPGCCQIVDPMPDPIPLGAKALGLYNYTASLVNANRFLPFNGAITGANSQASLSTLLASIAARDMQLWFVPAYRQQQTTNNSGRGQYDHAGTMAKFALFSGFTDANLPRIPFAIPYDEPLCGPCWLNNPPTETEVKAGCAAVTSYLGVPCAIRMSPIKMLQAGWTPGAGNIRIGMAQFGGRTGYDADGFGDDYTGYIAAQISAATTLGLIGILWGLNPFRQLSAGWLPAWTDAYLLDKLTKAAGAGMNYGVYMYTGYPPSARLLLPSTNAVLVTAAGLL